MNILVVGSGLAGLALALGLVSKQDDIFVDIIERRPHFDRRGATFGLAPNGLVALDELCPDALRHLQTVGIPIHDSYGYLLPWWEVHNALLSEARKQKDRICIHMGMELDQVLQSNHGLSVQFKHKDMILKGSVLIGADGVHSQIRTQILKFPPAVPTGTLTWRGHINVTHVPLLQHLTKIDTGKSHVFGSKLHVVYFNFDQTLPGLIAWTAHTKLTISSGVTTPLDLLEQFEDELCLNEDHTLDNQEKQIRANVETAKQVFQQSLEIDLTCSSVQSVVDLQGGWGGSGRITLIGDAAHAVRPFSGLGGSLAFEDAVILSRMLSNLAATKHGDDCKWDGLNHHLVTATLRQFEALRLPRVRRISEDQTMRSEAIFQNGASMQPWTEGYRKWVFMGPDAPSEPPLERCDSSH